MSIIIVTNTEKLLNCIIGKVFLKRKIEHRRQQNKKRNLRILGENKWESSTRTLSSIKYHKCWNFFKKIPYNNKNNKIENISWSSQNENLWKTHKIYKVYLSLINYLKFLFKFKLNKIENEYSLNFKKIYVLEFLNLLRKYIKFWLPFHYFVVNYFHNF